MAIEPSDPYFLALANCPVFGARTLEKLEAAFESWRQAWEASEEQLIQLGVPQKRLELFFKYKQASSPAVVDEYLRQHHIITITRQHEHYSPLLHTIDTPPMMLFALGDTSLLTKTAVAIVGSRNATSYGLKHARAFASALAAKGVIIVSGLARGIDSAAHEGALDSGQTIAVLGSGLLHKGTREQTNLQARILAKGGLIVSEFPVNLGAYDYHFPMRNRIIAGLTKTSLIVEAEQPSGSLITAQAALNNGKDVFAIPGPIDSPYSAGTNDLCKDGAHVATTPNDLLLFLGLSGTTDVRAWRRQAPTSADPLESHLLTSLHSGPKHVDELISSSQSSPALVSQALMNLELNGLVKNLGGMRYSL